MKFILALSFLLLPFILSAQYLNTNKFSFGTDASFEFGRKSFPGINIPPHDSDDNISAGGLIAGGFQVGKLFSERFMVKASIVWQLSPQGLIMAKHDTTARFFKLNICPSLRYYIPLHRDNAIARARWFFGAGPQVGIAANIKERSPAQHYSAEVKYKPALGFAAETGCEVVFLKHFSAEVGLRVRFIKYSISSYNQNGMSLPVDQAGSVTQIDASAVGYFAGLKWWGW
jgi:hypothetical protein